VSGEDRVNTGDTAWVLLSTALVFLMVPERALFDGGLVGEVGNELVARAARRSAR
jgi:ammonia channel protein AmtB